MDLTIVEAPRTTALTTLARMRRELGLEADDTSQDERLTDLIEEVSADIISFCNQPLIRQTVTERLVGYGRPTLILHVTPVPVAGVTEVLFNDEVIEPEEYRITDPDAGFLYRSLLWDNTRPVKLMIEVDPVAMHGSADFELTYTGGYILPGDDITASGITAVASDSSFNYSDGTFPILVSGEYIRATGFTGGNNGRFKVLSRTLTKLIVDGSLTDETGGMLATIASRTLPRDLESAAIHEIRYRYQTQRRDPSVSSERLGDWGASYSDPGQASSRLRGVDAAGLHETTAMRLIRWQRLE